MGERVGFVTSGASLFQFLGVSIEADTSYALSALIGHRMNLSFGGVMGFFAGDPSNVIGSLALSDPGEGAWGLQSYTLDKTFLNHVVGQQLGIFFLGGGQQFNLDRVLVEYFREDDDVLVNPVPGAVWLFGTALLGGWFAGRKRRMNAANRA